MVRTFLKTWIFIVVLILCLDKSTANIDNQEHFCGVKLSKTLSELCAIYNTPKFDHNRLKRQIIQECCRSQCSRRHMVKHYCSKAHNSVIHEMSKTTLEPTALREFENSYVAFTTTKPSSSRRFYNLRRKNMKRGKRNNCGCRKRRTQRLNRYRVLMRKNSSTNLPNLGHIEQFEQPFYVLRSF